MNFRIILLGITLCITCAASEKQYTSINKIALKLMECVTQEDADGCINLAIHYEQISSFIKKVKYSKEEYNKKVKQHVQKLILEFKQQEKIEVIKVNIAEAQILYPEKDSKVKQQVVFVFLGYLIKREKREIETPPFFFFVQIGKEWKWSIMK